MIHGDFETRSFCDLIKHGGYNYAMHPTTQATLFGFAFDDDDPEIWVPLVGAFWDKLRRALADRGHVVHSQFPQSIIHAVNADEKIAAHNAAFERLIFWYVICPDFDVPEIPLESFYCTATQARANNMPGQLGDCAKALRGEQQKDNRGKQLIQTLCVPHDGKFIEDLDQYIEFAEYCLQDVRTERAISKAMRPLTDYELDEYYASEIINDKGLMVDIELARAAVNYSDAEQADLIKEIQDLTNGAVKKARGRTLTNWVYERLPEAQQSHMHKYVNGERKITFDRNARERIILDPDTPIVVKDVAEYSDFAQASSTSKFKAMLNRADDDDHRVRGAYVFDGAASTGRYSSRGLQVHNFPRDKLKDPESIAEMLIADTHPDFIEAASGHSLMQTLKRLLRHSIVAAPGYTFVCGDWNQVEGRMCPWLSIGTNPATDVFAQQKLDAYANQTHERDVYCGTASQIYHSDVYRDGSQAMEDMRQIGKVAELFLQFGGGEGAFGSACAQYGIHVDDSEKTRIKQVWRTANPWAQPFWNALHKAAVAAVRNPGSVFHAGRIQYLFHPEIMGGTLWALLPCGRVLAYPQAQVKAVDGRYGLQYELSALKSNWKPKADEAEWPRVTLWPGLLAENVTQSACASTLRDALVYLVFNVGVNTTNCIVSGHTHDEILLEVPERDTEYWRGVLESAMLTCSVDWLIDMPLAVDIWTGPNFRK